MEKLTAADLKWLAKFVPAADLSTKEKTEIRETLYSEKVPVTPAVGLIYDTVLAIYVAREFSSKLARIHPDLKVTNAVSNFDRGKYIVLKLDSNAYMKLID